jgi:AcrR family transcriptional regulator
MKLTKERILDAARRHFARFGFRKASLSEIAAELGVVKGALYYYVPGGKQELFDLVLQRDLDQVLAAMRAAVEAEPDPRRRLRAMADARLRVVTQLKDLLGVHRDVLEEVTAIIYQQPNHPYSKAERGLIEEILRSGEAAGLFRKIEPRETAAAATQAAMRTLLIPAMYAEQTHGAEPIQLLEPLFDLMLLGLESRG